MYDEIKHVGKISMESIPDFILGNSITGNGALFLNQADFDEVALQYRETQGEGISIPFYLHGVLIEEDDTGEVPQGSIGFVRVHEREK